MDINRYSILALAFIGDAAYNLTVKRMVIDKEVKSGRMQDLAALYCSAKTQAKIAGYLIDNQLLSDQEIDLFKRGRNAKSHSAPKNTDVVTYRISTGFEALWGYWYLNDDQKRLEQIWNIVETIEV